MIESIKCEIVKAMQGTSDSERDEKENETTDGSKMCERRFDLKHLAAEFFSLIFYFHKITIDSFCFCFLVYSSLHNCHWVTLHSSSKYQQRHQQQQQ